MIGKQNNFPANTYKCSPAHAGDERKGKQKLHDAEDRDPGVLTAVAILAERLEEWQLTYGKENQS